HDGRAPDEIRKLAREDIADHETVELRDATVHSVREEEDGFVAETDQGPIEAHMLVLATGLTDVLPDLPGFREAWGREVAACPFCHGHELAGRRIGLVGEGPHVPTMVAMLAPIAAEVLTFGSDEVVAVEPIGDGLLLRLRAGAPVEVA